MTSSSARTEVQLTDDSSNGNGAKEPTKHGFASWDLEKRTRVAAKGGRAAHAAGTAHQFTSAEAKAAGRKGGIAVHAKNKAREAKAATQGKQPQEETK
jgi:uncharacterized protein